MSFIAIWRKNFSVLYTIGGYHRLMKLMEEQDLQSCQVIERALALYAKAVDWESNPVFLKDDRGEMQPCRLPDYIWGPSGLTAYKGEYFCTWHEWRVIRGILAKSGDANLSVMMERALELLEITLEEKLPHLYTFDNRLDFHPTSLPLDKTFV